MTAKIKINLDLDRISRQIKSDFERNAPKLLQKEILETISRGVSPVNTPPSRYKDYSDSYKEQIDNKKYKEFGKRKRPINLKLSGELHKSLEIKPNGNGQLIVKFKNYLADIHNRLGAGKSQVVRRILPREDIIGEEFSRNIMRKLRTLVDNIVKLRIK